jgi:hypothetical protein
MNKSVKSGTIFHFPFEICHCLILSSIANDEWKWKTENRKELSHGRSHRLFS